MSALFPAAFFVVAALYSSVGHGGASGYLALLALASLAGPEAAAGALALNVLVAGVALASFARAGHLNWRLTWPFLVGSVPAAYAGGHVRLSGSAYSAALAAALAFAAWRLWRGNAAAAMRERPSPWAAAPTGAAIGAVSGALGIGGGVFLSPLVMLLGWADGKTTAATSACFILFNSAAALIARRGQVAELASGACAPYLLAALAGAAFGSWCGAGPLSERGIRRCLSAVLTAASMKLLLTA